MIKLNPMQLRAAAVAILGISAVLMWRAWGAWHVFEVKVVAQQRETAAISDYMQRHEALKKVQKRFDSDYPANNLFSDWASYFQYLDFPSTGLDIDVDTLSISISEIPPNEPSGGLGLRRACIGNGGGGDLVVKAKTYGSLLRGVEKLLRRPDISATAVAIAGNQQLPEARIANFCLLFRTTTAG